MKRELPAPQDDGDRKLLADVLQRGWHVVKVPGDDRAPGWCFTVGLQHTFEHPELVIFGLPLGTGHAVLNIAGEAITRGVSFEADRAYGEFLEGFVCILRPVDKGWFRPFLGYAMWFYRGAGFDAMQVFWPGRDGAMPWSPTASDWQRANQPRLFESNEQDAGVTDLLKALEEE